MIKKIRNNNIQITKSSIITFLILLYFTNNQLLAQNDKSVSVGNKKTTFIDLNLGTQVSGIRKEDYVASNFTPYYQLSVGNWFTPFLALAVSYQGPYFNFIGDNVRHNYLYLDGSVRLDIFRLFDKSYQRPWSIILLGGSGYFYNYHYKRPNICASVGIIGTLSLNNSFSLQCKLSNIMGWDIYQGDEDALTNLSIGGTIKF